MQPNQKIKYSRRQSGSTLIVSLIILIMLMLLGVTSINSSDTQFKLTGNLQFENVAMNNAEIAARAAEQWLEVNATGAPATNAINTLPDPLTTTWSNANSVDVTGDGMQRYMIGYVGKFNSVGSFAAVTNCGDPNVRHFDCVFTYQIYAYGQGGQGSTKYIQTYYAVRQK